MKKIFGLGAVFVLAAMTLPFVSAEGSPFVFDFTVNTVEGEGPTSYPFDLIVTVYKTDPSWDDEITINLSPVEGGTPVLVTGDGSFEWDGTALSWRGTFLDEGPVEMFVHMPALESGVCRIFSAVLNDGQIEKALEVCNGTVPEPTATKPPEPTCTPIVEPTSTPIPEPTPEIFSVNFNANSPDGFGHVVTTTYNFDLILTVYKVEPLWEDEVIVGVTALSDAWEINASHGIGEFSWDGTKSVWSGEFPEEGPIELVYRSPYGIPPASIATYLAEVAPGPITRTVEVINSLHVTYFPVVLRGD